MCVLLNRLICSSFFSNSSFNRPQFIVKKLYRTLGILFTFLRVLLDELFCDPCSHLHSSHWDPDA